MPQCPKLPADCSPSCWGCGFDYEERWKKEELSEMGIFLICPDCQEELGEEEVEKIAQENPNESDNS